uniref:Zinc finger protein 750-like zinc finger domain-containing protein n=1 Tax=Pygocentrus nattereri TaxID=42514 RepID=A0AAR2K3U2_PYGNA
MPKEECKVPPGCKQHKERKPKKPHYIPRPFGKPYNYKCFQCPFTCMEKSHLYNHMKYSLCKNSLSLLIESDWPYKKGNLPAKETPEGDTVAEDASIQAQNLDLSFNEAEETEMEERGGEGGGEVEAKLRHYRLSKTCLSGPAALLSEQFRLLSNQTASAKPKSDTLAAGSLPCYPPPLTTGHVDCSEAPGLNLSLLGVGYPLTSVTPGLFSYLNPALSAIGPLPFLASAAQLTHTHTHSDRTLLTSPRLYYPFLCEHTFGNHPSSPGSSPLHGLERAREQGEEKERGTNRGMESCAAALLRDLSSALQEYHHAERQAALQPEQRHLWAHLGKIRSELSHIQQALERTARQSDGPLDLSVKKDAVAMTIGVEGIRQPGILGDRKEAKEETWCSETDEEEEDRDEGEMDEEGNEMKERRKRSLDVLIKLNQSAISMVKPGAPLVKPGISMVKSEVLPGVGGGLALRAAEAEALWHSRTTKCEADSSVLLCSKTPNRPSSIQHLDPVCPPSPLTATDA